MPSPVSPVVIENNAQPQPPPRPPPVQSVGMETFQPKTPDYERQIVSPLDIKSTALIDSVRVEQFAGFGMLNAQHTNASTINLQQDHQVVTDKSLPISSTLNHQTQAAKTLTTRLCQGCNKQAPWIRCEAQLCHNCPETWVKRSFGWDQTQKKYWYCAKCLVGLNWTVDILSLIHI